MASDNSGIKEAVKEIKANREASILFFGWLGERIKDGTIEVDFGGHFGFPLGAHKLPSPGMDKWDVNWVIRAVIDEFRIDFMYDNNLLSRIAGHMKGEPLREPITLRSNYSTESQCGECSEKVSFRYDGNIIKATKKCAVPGGLPEFHVDVEIPSGYIVFDNDLRKLIPEKEPKNYDVGSNVSIKLSTEWFAEQGLVLIYVGNSCPAVYRMSSNFFMVGNLHECGDLAEKELEGPQELVQGTICTDLWWYSAMDYDLYLEKGGERLDENTEWAFKVKVQPGTYRFTSYKQSPHYDTDDDGIYSIIRRLRTI